MSLSWCFDNREQLKELYGWDTWIAVDEHGVRLSDKNKTRFSKKVAELTKHLDDAQVTGLSIHFTGTFSWRPILSNKAQCLSCYEVIESTHRHDFRSCKCGRIAVDGGTAYLRRVGNVHGGYLDLSQLEGEEPKQPRKKP